ncbi:hypothetical protein ACSJL4_001603 [Serratia nematodiphila]
MLEKQFFSESLSKISYLRAHGYIESEQAQRLQRLVRIGHFDEVANEISSLYKQHELNPKNGSDFIDFADENYNEDESPNENRKQNFIISKLKNELKSAKNDNDKIQSSLNSYRSKYRQEQIELSKKNEEIESINKEYQILKTEYDKLASERQQKRIENKIPEYVKDVSNKLDSDDNLFMKKSQRWSRSGIFISLLATVIALYTFKAGFEALIASPNLGYIAILFVFFRGILAIGILSWVAFICFNMSSSYIHESILRKDRQHALSFGRLFLQIYGDTATKNDAIEVFKDWNRSGDSAFSKRHISPPNIFKLAEAFKKTTSKEESIE